MPGSVGISAVDWVFLRRACELAERGRGSTSPNPPVGAVVATGKATAGEGYHRRCGEPHAEIEALAEARRRGAATSGATMYVTLEPCDHAGRTAPCARALIDAGIARVVIGARDPNPLATGGIARLLDAGITVDLADDAWSRRLIEEFAGTLQLHRPYVRLKMAVSLDGYIANRPGVQQWLTGPQTRDYVRELRASYDAVMVGAGTVRVDDPELTVRPPRARRVPYVRVVVCEVAPVPPDRMIFREVEGYADTIVLAPMGARKNFVELETIADVCYVGDDDALRIDLGAAMKALRGRGITSVLCEGGPTLVAGLLRAGLVDRFDWIVAQAVLSGPDAVPAIRHGVSNVTPRFDRIERLGDDLLVSWTTVPCSAD